MLLYSITIINVRTSAALHFTYSCTLDQFKKGNDCALCSSRLFNILGLSHSEIKKTLNSFTIDKLDSNNVQYHYV